jgi:hypothetical protein
MPMTNVSVIFGLVDATVSNEAAVGWAAFGGVINLMVACSVIYVAFIMAKTIYDQYVVSEGIFQNSIGNERSINAMIVDEYRKGWQLEKPSTISNLIELVKSYW